MKINVAGVLIDNLSKQEAIAELDKIVRMDKNVYCVTPYSELIVFALNDTEYKKVLNKAEISLPDGIGVLWAAKYLSSPQIGLIKSLFAILFNPKYIRLVIQEKISGSDLIYDIAKLAAEKNYSISLVGGSDNVAVQSSYELKKLYPDLNIKLALSDRPFDDSIVKEISESNSDILLIAASPPKQETWMADNIQKLNVKAVLGLGGTFDYLAKKRPAAPNFMRSAGLEWLWRLITQPWRIKRIWNAVPVFVWKVYRYKVNNEQK